LRKPTVSADARYGEVMSRIRERFDTIEGLRASPSSWSAGETIGTHLRKVIEGIAFGCVIAMEHSTKDIPRQVAGHWNAENIFVTLKKLAEFPYPDPNQIRAATFEEKTAYDVATVFEGVEANRIPVDDLRDIYRRTHPWTHEDNPYVVRPTDEKNFSNLLDDASRVERMLRLHRIGIHGKSFICTIRDEQDSQVKVHMIDKIQGL
jgi:hypothetical protein